MFFRLFLVFCCIVYFFSRSFLLLQMFFCFYGFGASPPLDIAPQWEKEREKEIKSPNICCGHFHSPHS